MIPGVTTWALWVALAAATPHQAATPKLLLRSAHCLVSKGFLPPERESTVALGYYLDDASYPGERVVYVVAYTAADRARGAVFAVFVSKTKGGLEFSVQNNATFAPDENEPGGVDFVNPPLGGTWTQQRLVAAIRRIGGRPIYRLRVSELRGGLARTVCTAYTDPQPTEGGGT